MPQQIPVTRSVFDTADPEIAYEFMRRTYAGMRVHADRHEGAHRMSVRSLASGAFSIDDVHYPVHLQLDCDPFKREMFVYVRKGRLRGAVHDRNEYRWLPGDWGAYPSGVPLDFDLDTIEDQAVSLPADVVARAAARIDGKAPVRFTGWAPVSRERYRTWDATVHFVRGQLAAPDSPMAEPLVQERMLDLLAVAALTTFPNTTMAHVYEPGPGRVGHPALRRALAYIEANAHRPITIADIAEAAGTTPRAVQYAFRRHLDTTPTRYLRRIRLQRAHQELVAADPTTGKTVKQIAARWGFAGPGTFAVLYRTTYGTTPSHTLHH